MSQPATEPEPLRVPLSRLRGDADDLLATARRCRAPLTRRGKVVGEVLWRDDPDVPASPTPPPSATARWPTACGSGQARA